MQLCAGAAFSMFNMLHGTGPLNCKGPNIEKVEVVKRKSLSTYLDYFFFIIWLCEVWMSYYIIEFFKYKIAQGLYIVRDGPGYVTLLLFFLLTISLFTRFMPLIYDKLCKNNSYYTSYCRFILVDPRTNRKVFFL